MSAAQQKAVQRRPTITVGKMVVAIRRGYWGTEIKDPDGSEAERAPFRVPADAKATWFVPVDAAQADEADIG